MGFEVSERFFKQLTHGKSTPYLITGSPAVRIYPKGAMDLTLRMESLTVEDIIELKSKKAAKLAKEQTEEKEKLKKDLEELEDHV